MITKSERRGGLTFQMKTDRLAEVGNRLIERAALGDDGNFDALRHITGLVTRPDHRFNSLLQVGHACTVLDFYRGCKAKQPATWASPSGKNRSRGEGCGGLKDLIARSQSRYCQRSLTNQRE